MKPTKKMIQLAIDGQLDTLDELVVVGPEKERLAQETLLLSLCRLAGLRGHGKRAADLEFALFESRSLRHDDDNVAPALAEATCARWYAEGVHGLPPRLGAPHREKLVAMAQTGHEYAAFLLDELPPDPSVPDVPTSTRAKAPAKPAASKADAAKHARQRKPAKKPRSARSTLH